MGVESRSSLHSDNFRSFQGRVLLKVVACGLLALWAGLMALAILAGTTTWSGRAAHEMLTLIVPMLGAVGLPILALLNESFSRLVVDARGVTVHRVVLTKVARWEEVVALHHREMVELHHGAPVREYELRMEGRNGQTLLLLKSTYGREALQAVLDKATAQGKQVFLTPWSAMKNG